MQHQEHNLQVACVRYFRYRYPNIAPLLFAVPNGGNRNLREAARLKAEGVTPGVADLILLLPSRTHHALCLELKTDKGRLSPQQKEWLSVAEKYGAKTAVIRSIDDFILEVDNYLEVYF